MRFRCCNPSCGQFPMGFEFHGKGNDVCPKCGSKGPPFIVPLVDVHFIVVGTGKGPIYGSTGRQYVACQPKRDALAKHQCDDFVATGEVNVVTCPACMQTREFRERAAAEEVTPEQLQAAMREFSRTK